MMYQKKGGLTMKEFELKKSAKLISATLAGSISLVGIVHSDENPFMAQDLSSGYMLAGHGEHDGSEGKCGEGKCGKMKNSQGKPAEGKCGEGKCGEMKNSQGE